MENSKRKVKQVNLQKLEKLSDDELRSKISDKDAKIQKKQSYYQSLNQMNNDRLEAYKKHRQQEASIAAHILNQRKAKSTEKDS